MSRQEEFCFQKKEKTLKVLGSTLFTGRKNTRCTADTNSSTDQTAILKHTQKRND